MQTVNSKDGTQIAYDEIGSGPAVILVGGALQYRSFDPRTAQLAELLSQHYRSFHYDRRGRGDSGNNLPYDKQREIEDLEAIIRKAGGSAMVFAMSSGGNLALEAANQGLKITRLALYEPALLVDSGRPAVPDDYVAQLTSLAAEGRRGDAVEYFLVEGAGVPAEYVAPMRQAPMWLGMEAVAHTLAYDGAFTADVMGGRPLPPARWGSISIPVLVIDGGASPAYVHNSAQALAGTLKEAQHRTVEGQDHAYDPNVVAPILEEFFSS